MSFQSLYLQVLKRSTAVDSAVVLAQGEGMAAMLPLMGLIAVLFYFMIIRPETRRRSQQEEMHKNLKKNDRVLTIGGIYGTVVNAQQGQDEITIKVDENTNTRLRIARTSIQAVVNSKEKEDGQKAAS